MYGQRGQKKWRLCRRVVNQTIILIFRSFAHFSSLTGLESVASSCTKTLELRFLKIAPTFKVQDFLQVSPVPPPVPYPTPFINVLMVSRSGTFLNVQISSQIFSVEIKTLSDDLSVWILRGKIIKTKGKTFSFFSRCLCLTFGFWNIYNISWYNSSTYRRPHMRRCLHYYGKKLQIIFR